MKSIPSFTRTVFRAVGRARLSILTIALTYVVFIVLGIMLSHAGNSFALNARDQLVSKAVQQNPASIAYSQGHNLKAAIIDFGSNLIAGALPKSVSGMAVNPAYLFVAYQGWIGGIVSVREDHSSRLDYIRSAVYYLLTLLLQISAYSLAVGAGVNVGIAMFRPQACYRGDKWFGIFPKEALRDLGRIYTLVVPIFLVASLWEFLSPWNL